MQILKKYKSGWQIRLSKKGVHYLYSKGNNVVCDNLKDARFTHWCLTH